MVHLVTLATCALDQWALDFVGNLARTRQSIVEAKALGARYRIGPELELTGYGCEDHFLEQDTFDHAWAALAALLADAELDGILCDVGMPVMHRGVRYNCRVFFLDGRVVLVRPKLCLADDGNYREPRYFAAWARPFGAPLESLPLPDVVRAATARSGGGEQAAASFGVALIALRDAVIASESCEELFAPQSPSTALALAGTDIISNGSGSHHQLRKLHQRVGLMQNFTAKSGGVYLYSNQQGCDGGRLYYDGCASAFVNGECVAQGAQFSLRDVETIVATVDLDLVRSQRAAAGSRNVQAAQLAPALTPPTISLDHFALAPPVDSSGYLRMSPSLARAVRYHTPEEEIGLGPACWLWDYLRRSGAGGFFLPLSGGADSAATCAIVAVMCELVRAEVVDEGNRTVLADLRRIVGDPTFMPATSQDVCDKIMHTCYMGTVNSGVATRQRAEQLAAQVGAYHLHVRIDTVVAAVIALFGALALARTGALRMPRFESAGGSKAEDLALQNIQARVRMVVAYMLAQLLPWLRSGSGSASSRAPGWLLVLGSANVDEALRGYMTKYDCSSADVNPIGGVSKHDLRAFLIWAADVHGMPALRDIEGAAPTAELRPNAMRATAMASSASALTDSASASASASSAVNWAGGEGEDEAGNEGAGMQLDEAEMGMTYEELSWFGRLRKVQRCGPLSMYLTLLHVGEPPWAGLSPAVVAVKVRRFFYFYAANRHKMTTLTPSYHAESYSPDDNRYDLRPFLYNLKWDAQFAEIEKDVALRERDAAAAAKAGGV